LPSNAFRVHLEQLLHDAEELDDAHSELSTGAAGRQYGLASINRAIVVMSVSAWESFIEELMRESVIALRPAGPPHADPWPALNAYATGEIRRFHTPNAQNVAQLVQNCVGLPNIRLAWSWQNCTSAQAEGRLNDALTYRHQIAHGVNPRPIIHNNYSSALPGFIRRLARCTDAAVRNHLVVLHGVANPWPS
jgi:hypothetical protein